MVSRFKILVGFANESIPVMLRCFEGKETVAQAIQDVGYDIEQWGSNVILLPELLDKTKLYIVNGYFKLITDHLNDVDILCYYTWTLATPEELGLNG